MPNLFSKKPAVAGSEAGVPDPEWEKLTKANPKVDAAADQTVAEIEAAKAKLAAPSEPPESVYDAAVASDVSDDDVPEYNTSTAYADQEKKWEARSLAGIKLIVYDVEPIPSQQYGLLYRAHIKRTDTQEKGVIVGTWVVLAKQLLSLKARNELPRKVTIVVKGRVLSLS